MYILYSIYMICHGSETSPQHPQGLDTPAQIQCQAQIMTCPASAWCTC